jgi:hypothetical protein
MITDAALSKSGVTVDGVACDVYQGEGVFAPFKSHTTFVAVASAARLREGVSARVIARVVRIWAPTVSNYTCDYSRWTSGVPTIPPVPNARPRRTRSSRRLVSVLCVLRCHPSATRPWWRPLRERRTVGALGQ